MNNFQPGHFAPVAWQATGLAAVTLQIKDHNVEMSVLLHDVTHTGTAGVRGRIAGPRDASGSVNASLDLDLPPYGAASIFEGLPGICAFGFSPLKLLQIPVRIEKVRYQSAVESEVKYGFDVKMSAFSGFIVYPAL